MPTRAAVLATHYGVISGRTIGRPFQHSSPHLQDAAASGTVRIGILQPLGEADRQMRIGNDTLEFRINGPRISYLHVHPRVNRDRSAAVPGRS